MIIFTLMVTASVIVGCVYLRKHILKDKEYQESLDMKIMKLHEQICELSDDIRVSMEHEHQFVVRALNLLDQQIVELRNDYNQR